MLLAFFHIANNFEKSDAVKAFEEIFQNAKHIEGKVFALWGLMFFDTQKFLYYKGQIGESATITTRSGCSIGEDTLESALGMAEMDMPDFLVQDMGSAATLRFYIDFYEYAEK